jgi:hypothetical protein
MVRQIFKTVTQLAEQTYTFQWFTDPLYFPLNHIRPAPEISPMIVNVYLNFIGCMTDHLLHPMIIF